jgi:hypothetical protein
MHFQRHFLVWAYLLLPAIFISGNMLSLGRHAPQATHWPSLRMTDLNSSHSKVTRLDVDVLRQSMQRLPSARFIRQAGNSLRLFLGQSLSWCVWSKDSPAMLFATVELWVSEGLTPANQRLVENSLALFRKQHRLLASEGWTLVVVPVPTKLSIYRDRCSWPVMEKNLLTRQPVERDRADEIYDQLINQLRAAGIPAVDLKSLYRQYRVAHPAALLYPAGETHWSGLGMAIAADATAELISNTTGIPRRQFTPSYFPVDEIADIAAAFDPLPFWTSRLTPLYRYQDRLVDGEKDRGFQYASNPTSLLIVAGTSYTGQFTWHIGHPVGFSWVVGGQLENCEFHNNPQAGSGSYAAFAQFMRDRHNLAQTFSSRRALTDFSKVVVWEFPVRDLADIEKNLF